MPAAPQTPPATPPSFDDPHTSTSASTAASSSPLVLAHRGASPKPTKKPVTKARKPKSKTGCLTCKYRRVKCDERKPYCLRCERFLVECEGYNADRKLPASSRRPRVILPRSRSVVLLKPPPPKIPRLTDITPIYSIHAGPRFADEFEGQSFRAYLDHMAKRLQGPFHGQLWERLIPQASELVPFVRHAIIAIGAMSRMCGGSAPEPIQGVSKISYTLRKRHCNANGFQYALKHYDKALRGMREAIAEGQHDLRKALIACLLVFCFEGLLGNQAAAAMNAESGLMLLYNWTNGRNPTGTPWRTKKSWDDHLFEQDLMEAFTTLDLQVLFFIDNRSQAVHQATKVAQTAAIAAIPSELLSLDEARRYLQLIMSRNFHFNKSVQAVNFEELQKHRDETPWEGSASMQSGEILLSSDLGSDPLWQKAESRRYQADIDRWSIASAALFSRVASDAAGNEREKVVAAILQVLAVFNQIMLAGTFFKTETEYDVFLPEFATIVQLASPVVASILASTKGASLFQIDHGVVAALWLVASRCRVDAVRLKATDLLLSVDYREGIWDSQSIGHMAKWLYSVEKLGQREDGSIPEEHRAFLTKINVDQFQRRAMLQCTQRLPGGGVKTTDTVLTW